MPRFPGEADNPIEVKFDENGEFKYTFTKEMADAIGYDENGVCNVSTSLYLPSAGTLTITNSVGYSNSVTILNEVKGVTMILSNYDPADGDVEYVFTFTAIVEE